MLENWSQWVDGVGAFHLSIIPIMYALSIGFVVTWVSLCIAVIVGWSRRPWLQRLTLFASAVYLTVLFGLATNNLRVQYNTNSEMGIEGMRESISSRATRILSLFLNTLLLLALVQTAIPLFDRQREKRMVLWIGVALTAATQVVWGLSVFDDGNSVGLSIMPALFYLFQIMLSVMFAACVTYFIMTKWAFTSQRSLLPFSILAFICASLNIVFFIIDVAGWWRANWLDSISWGSTIIAIIVVWEWMWRVDHLQRRMEHQKVLGRRVFDDDVGFGAALRHCPNQDKVSSDTNPRYTHFIELDDVHINSSNGRYYKWLLHPIILVTDALVATGEIGRLTPLYVVDGSQSPPLAAPSCADDHSLQHFVYPTRRPDRLSSTHVHNVASGSSTR
jgi:hypothetical protein